MSTGSYLKSGISFGRNCIFSSTVLTKSLGEVFLMRKGNQEYSVFLSWACMWWTLWSHKTTKKLLQSGFYWLTLFKDIFEFCKTCPRCQI